MKSGGLLLVSLIAVLALAVACGDDGGGEETSRDTPSPPDVVQTPPATDEETAGSASAVVFEIVQREDVSFGATVRIVYRVTVSAPISEADLSAISEHIIETETSSQDVNAIGFLFFLAGTDTNSVYTAGKADWAPDGDWARADTVQAGDYSSHELGAIEIVES